MKDNESFGFFSNSESITSLRNVGYDNAGMAISELIDNSIQAKSSQITIVFILAKELAIKNQTTRIKEIATIDNGYGMDAHTLRQSLRLGAGTHHYDKSGRGNIGKFGFGLPQASINYAKRVDVWSWNESNPVKRAYIDLEDDAWISDFIIQEPDDEPIPKRYEAFTEGNKQGTIVLWKNIDKIKNKVDTIYKDIEDQVGRIYRYWLHKSEVSVRIIAYYSNQDEPTFDKYVKPVDPLFLMEDGKDTSDDKTPPPEHPMFQQYGIGEESEEYDIGDGEKASVTIRYSIAKIKQVWPGDGSEAPGNKPYGKFALENQGVSLLREGRELSFYKKWAFPQDKDSRNRWWGLEIEFPNSMDEIFGVTNNKQSAKNLEKLIVYSNTELKERYNAKGFGDGTFDELKKENYEEYIIVNTIYRCNKLIDGMMDEIKKYNFRSAKKEHTPNTGLDAEIFTRGVNNDGKKGASDECCQKDGTCELTEIVNEIDGLVTVSDDAKNAMKEAAADNKRCVFYPNHLNSTVFFDVQRVKNMLAVLPNTKHTVYNHLFSMMDELKEEMSPDEKHYNQVMEMIDYTKLVFEIWARMEDLADEENVDTLQRIRQDWGSMLAKYIRAYENKTD